MVYVLPGGSYKEVDLLKIRDQALAEACDVTLLEDAWEVSGSIPPYSMLRSAGLVGVSVSSPHITGSGETSLGLPLYG